MQESSYYVILSLQVEIKKGGVVYALVNVSYMWSLKSILIYTSLTICN